MNNLLLVEHCVVVELVSGEDYEWPYTICERQHTIYRSDIELLKKRQCAAAYYVICAMRSTTPNSKQPKVFDFGHFMLMLLCFLIHLVRNSWHIFRCILQIIVVHRLGSVVISHVLLSPVSLLSHSKRPLACIVICLHANGFFFVVYLYGSKKPYHWPYVKCNRGLFSFIFPPIPLFFILHIPKLNRDQRDITYFWQFTADTDASFSILAVNWAHAM